MSSEDGLWRAMQPKLAPFLTMHRVENRCELGTPDVAWTGKLPDGKPVRGVQVYRRASGWIELKEANWPADISAPLVIPKLTLEQVQWAEGWERAGGRVHALLQVDRDYLLVSPGVLRRIFKREWPYSTLSVFILGTGKFPTSILLHRLFA